MLVISLLLLMTDRTFPGARDSLEYLQFDLDVTDLTPDTDRTERNAIDFHERNSRFLNTSQIFKLFSNHFSIICKNVTEANSPFSPISSLPEVGHLDMETLSQQTVSNEWCLPP